MTEHFGVSEAKVVGAFSLGDLIARKSGAVRLVVPSAPVRYRTAEEIESLAERALGWGRQSHGDTFWEPPIDVEAFIEHVQPRNRSIPKLYLNFEENLHQYFTGRDEYTRGRVMGLSDLRSGNLFVDDSLNPSEHPTRMEEYRFVLAHELGHYQLHRSELVAGTNAIRGSRPALVDRPVIATRLSEERPDQLRRIEWQANCFAGCFLIPSHQLASLLQLSMTRGIHPWPDTEDGRDAARSFLRSVQRTFRVSFAAAHHRLRSFRHPDLEGQRIIPELLRWPT